MDKGPEVLSIAEKLAHSTVRLECILPNGNTSTGTGFLFSFAKNGGRNVPAIVTNRHVIADAVRGRFALTVRNSLGGPSVGTTVTAELDNFAARWTSHPDSNVDLCIMPIAPLLREAESQGRSPFYVPLDHSLIPSDDELKQLDVSENITMVGYPNGLWDRVNNMPIFRRGATATHPALDWNGNPEFIIDAACFPGSSGSPVFLLNVGGYSDKRGNTHFGGHRLRLLGVLYAGPLYTADGTIEVVPVPTSTRPIASTAIPMNLGIVIKAKALDAFDQILRAALSAAG